MRINTYVVFCIGCCCLLNHLSGQEVKVSDPVMVLEGNHLIISYDILHSGAGDVFNVSLRIEDEYGDPLPANALSGDVGEGVSGGNNKEIYWDLKADKIEINASIFVKIHVEMSSGQEQVGLAAEELSPMGHEMDSGTAESKEQKSFRRSGLLLQSAFFPGLGLSRYRGGAHWIKGVVGYGCVVTSVVLNRMAIQTYADIYDIEGLEAKDIQYQRAVIQDQASEILAYAAVAIWITDLAWTLAASSDLKKDRMAKAFRIRGGLDPHSRTPLLVFTWEIQP